MEQKMSTTFLVINVLDKIRELERATGELTMSFPDGEEPEWWNECLEALDNGMTTARCILRKNQGNELTDYYFGDLG